MKILLLGSGGREHALAWKISQSPKVERLFIAPGNAGTQGVGENVALKADDFEGIKTFVLSEGIDMVVVGPEDPLVKGIYDYFKADEALKDVPVIGPPVRVPCWRAARTLPRASCSATIFPRLPTRPSPARHSPKARPSSGHCRLLTY